MAVEGRDTRMKDEIVSEWKVSGRFQITSNNWATVGPSLHQVYVPVCSINSHHLGWHRVGCIHMNAAEQCCREPFKVSIRTLKIESCLFLHPWSSFGCHACCPCVRWCCQWCRALTVMWFFWSAVARCCAIKINSRRFTTLLFPLLLLLPSVTSFPFVDSNTKQ